MNDRLHSTVDLQFETLQPSVETDIKNYVSIDSLRTSSNVNKLSVSIKNDLIKRLLDLTTTLFAGRRVDGFHHKQAPSEYLRESFNNEITRKLKELLVNHVVINELMNHLYSNKVVACNYPRLIDIDTPTEGPWSFNFNLSLTQQIELKEWRNFSFKPPKRKKYKDLDKQVINFLEQETADTKKFHNDIVEEQDWVFFETVLCDENNKPLQPSINAHFWINVKQHAGVDSLRNLLIGKKVGDTLCTDLLDFDSTANAYENYRYMFQATIKNIVKGGYLSLDLFRNNFKLKNKTDVHNKLMEVFSFRNDESQRRSTIEEVFHLLLSKHRFEVPKHLVLRRQEDLLFAIMRQPDYHVYKSQRDFHQHLELLAEKQLKEEILVDQIAFQENLHSDMHDAQNYLHLFGNKKLHEFIYFKPTVSRLDQYNTPFNLTLLEQTFTREKTLNFIIHAMTH